ncbi:MAG: hypothetical protein COU28_00585 [Candidatus Magasanikbacteria bacterium CG10_big_fil_rev_8_21_14_0_10_36_16]|uniref:Uncharacterized protein n=1 Tax=Candidatus Magasanikbacteria bacterium CG10_big_fil_rev_8_21_14_0_10_36_16 TaxID=1974645 RepID=A0A2H0TZH3_9BACT|nr:MAG: hypothetical protein COU28_00585 [Candidatus Magasanikbacteria bacterium CG10_big_fil_rev_8_21_14_0_10_36_16]
MPKKNLRTIKETLKGGNVKSINKKTLEKKKNAELIKKADANKLPGYHTVKRKGQKKFLRSNQNPKKKDNLDPLWDKKR